MKIIRKIQLIKLDGEDLALVVLTIAIIADLACLWYQVLIFKSL